MKNPLVERRADDTRSDVRSSFSGDAPRGLALVHRRGVTGLRETRTRRAHREPICRVFFFSEDHFLYFKNHLFFSLQKPPFFHKLFFFPKINFFFSKTTFGALAQCSVLRSSVHIRARSSCGHVSWCLPRNPAQVFSISLVCPAFALREHGILLRHRLVVSTGLWSSHVGCSTA